MHTQNAFNAQMLALSHAYFERHKTTHITSVTIPISVFQFSQQWTGQALQLTFLFLPERKEITFLVEDKVGKPLLESEEYVLAYITLIYLLGTEKSGRIKGRIVLLLSKLQSLSKIAADGPRKDAHLRLYDSTGSQEFHLRTIAMRTMADHYLFEVEKWPENAHAPVFLFSEHRYGL